MYLSDDGDVLDLTGNQLKDLAGIPLPPTLTDLDLTTNRLAALDPRIGDLERLEKLSFRQNLITDAAAAGLKDLNRLTSLKELVLRDNLLKKVPCVSPLTALSLLDLSYNHIHAMAPLTSSALPALRELYLANNRIGHIEALEGFTQLRLLELGSNKIRVSVGRGGEGVGLVGYMQGGKGVRLVTCRVGRGWGWLHAGWGGDGVGYMRGGEGVGLVTCGEGMGLVTCGGEEGVGLVTCGVGWGGGGVGYMRDGEEVGLVTCGVGRGWGWLHAGWGGGAEMQ
ncbi:unnamed protein product [Closterium sp. Naga37s-1]|nr:unnamed protein product [Closterium sp. Naga37s-1]